MRAWAAGRNMVGYILAGLETGVLGGLLALAWYGFSSAWHGQPLWLAPVRMGASLIREGFVRGSLWSTVLAGVALQISVGGVLGAFFGLIVRDGRHVLRVTLAGLVFGLACYWLCYVLLWQSALAATPLPASSRSVLFAHLLFGAHLGRYPQLLRAGRAVV